MSSEAHAPGNLLIVAAPSGAGKSSLVNALLESDARLVLSISHTTRTPRPGERDGEWYHFIDQETFDRQAGENAFLEYARVFDHCYGTSAAAVNALLDEGRDVILEIDWQGARQVRAARSEISHWQEFDFLVVNDDFDTALADLRAIIRSLRLKLPYRQKQYAPLIEELLA